MIEILGAEHATGKSLLCVELTWVVSTRRLMKYGVFMYDMNRVRAG